MEFEGHYVNWITSRLNTLEKYLGSEFFSGKSVFEAGCGYGHIGNRLSQWGALLTCSDIRQEHISKLQQLYPTLPTRIDDLTQPIENMSFYNVIIHFALLNHLSNPEQHLKNIMTHCDYFIIECDVIDSNKLTLTIDIQEEGYDKAYNGTARILTQRKLETIFTQCGFNYRLIQDSVTNSDFHIYNWPSFNTDKYREGFSRFWICWRVGLHHPFVFI
jgi:SAM-dependent methyltransferase